MESIKPGNPGLYSQACGSRWHELAEVIRRLHAPGAMVCAVGTFRVCRGTNRLARILGWLAGLPAECEAVEVNLRVTPTSTGEEWRRLFDGRPFTTTQWLRDGTLVEIAGRSELQFHLEVRDGALHYQARRCAVRWGFVRLPLPGWLAPRVTAWEKPDADRVSVFVEMQVPLVGRLISYEGTLMNIETKPC